MKTRPMAVMTSARLPFLVSIRAAPRPGVWRGKFSGRIRRGARATDTPAFFPLPGGVARVQAGSAGLQKNIQIHPLLSPTTDEISANVDRIHSASIPHA